MLMQDGQACPSPSSLRSRYLICGRLINMIASARGNPCRVSFFSRAVYVRRYIP
jgi:hypothetical protein